MKTLVALRTIETASAAETARDFQAASMMVKSTPSSSPAGRATKAPTVRGRCEGLRISCPRVAGLRRARGASQRVLRAGALRGPRPKHARRRQKDERTRRMPQHVVRGASHEQIVDRGVTVRAHHHKIRLESLGLLDD